MGQKARNYSELTKRRLYALSGNQCAFPDCNVEFVNEKDDTNFSNICHIEDANPNKNGKADRYNPNMTEQERAGYPNLILICPNHHIETNDPKKYTVEALQKMKRDHEGKIRKAVAGENSISKHPSILNEVVSQLGSKPINEHNVDEIITAPNIEEKIEYNSISTYKWVIEKYKIYQGKLNIIYQEIDNQGSSKKDILLNNINDLYLQEKSNYDYDGIKQTKENADTIFENIKNKLWDKIQLTNNNMPIEALEPAILIVMVDAFMRCKILEKPPTNDH